MTWQLATAKIYNGSTWVNAAGGSDVWQCTDGTTAPILSSNVTVTASGTAHTKGAWIELVASTPHAADRLYLALGANNTINTNSAALFDIGIGAAGAEAVIVPDIPCGFAPNAGASATFDIPIRIAAGTRIAARMQSAITSKTMTIASAIARSSSTFTTNAATTVTTWGANTTTSSGITIAQGNNVKGAWTQITADCGSARKWIALSVQGNANNNMTACTHKVDIGIGAAGAEAVIVPDISIVTNTVETISFAALFRGYFVRIPANSRLVVRSQGTNANATANIDVTLTGQSEVGSL